MSDEIGRLCVLFSCPILMRFPKPCPIFCPIFDEIFHPVPRVGALFWWDLHTLWPSNDTAVLYCSYWLQGQNSVHKGDDLEAEHTHNLMEATCHAWNVQFIVSNFDEISSLCPIFLSNFWWDFEPMSNFSVQYLMRWQKTKIGSKKK